VNRAETIQAVAEQTAPRPRPATLARLTQDDFTECIEDHYRNAIAAGNGEGEEWSLTDSREWFLSMMPMLTSRRSVQLYIALTAYGRQTNLLTAEDAKRCLYVAQLALAAFGTTNEGPEARLLRAAREGK